jgi:MATE family multidrug resistance protein
MVVSVPIIALWEFSEPILNALVPEPELVAFASLYLRILALGVPGYAMFEAGKRYVQAQGNYSHSQTLSVKAYSVSRVVHGFHICAPDQCSCECDHELPPGQGTWPS